MTNKTRTEKRHFIVTTHLGDYSTWAMSEAKAFSNVRYRIYGCSCAPWESDYWTIREIGEVA